MTIEEHIFYNGSRTYYNAAKLLPRQLRRDVAELYSFVRTADDYVDVVPQNIAAFAELRSLWMTWRNKPVAQLSPNDDDTLNLRVTKNVCRLASRHQFEPEWIDAFLQSMQWDIDGRTYKTLDDSLQYVYGSAEVIGFMMAKMVGAPPSAMAAAAAQGRAMQWINFVRDIAEDVQLGRQYFPQDELLEYKLQDLSQQTALAKPGSFTAFMELQLGRYAEWRRQAEPGLDHIPPAARRAVRVVVDGYSWTAQHISPDPLIVYQRKVKPSKSYLLARALSHALD